MWQKGKYNDLLMALHYSATNIIVKHIKPWHSPKNQLTKNKVCVAPEANDKENGNGGWINRVVVNDDTSTFISLLLNTK